jgi:hypothetical protein
MAAITSVTTYEYATGTCALRLVGQLSPLSEVANRPVLGRSRFHLQVYQGDSQGGEATSPVLLEIRGREPQFSAFARLVQNYVQSQLNAAALEVRTPVTEGANSIQPVGLTRHRLIVTSADPPTAVELSTLQLADLAEALEQAETSLQLLAEGDLSRAARPAWPRLPLWVGSVAAVGIAALLGNQFLTTPPSPVVTAPQTAESAPADAESRPFALDHGVANGGLAGEPLASGLEPEASGTGVGAEAIVDANAPVPGAAQPFPQTTAPGAAPNPLDPPGGKMTGVPPAASPSAPSPLSSGRSAADRSAPAAALTPPGVVAPQLSQPQTFQTQPIEPEAASIEDPTPLEDPQGTVGIAAAPGPAATDWVSRLSQSLEQEWRPPANLAAPLLYTLTLDSNGAITALTPLNRFSATFPGDTLLPPLGTIIPGVAREAAVTVEVQFLPSGEVLVLPNPSP